jgi:hypothetical protein
VFQNDDGDSRKKTAIVLLRFSIYHLDIKLLIVQNLQLVVLAAFVAYVTAQAGYAAPAYSPPAYPAGDYKPGYANGRVKIQVNTINE